MSTSMSDPTPERDSGPETGEGAPVVTTGNPSDKSSSLFDLRLLIGGLFVVFGLILTIAGFFTNDQEIAKADGININLWLGLAMLALGLFFLAWQRLRPLRLEGPSAAEQTEGGSRTGIPSH